MEESEFSISLVYADKTKKGEEDLLDLLSTMAELVVEYTCDEISIYAERIWIEKVSGRKKCWGKGIEHDKKADPEKNVTKSMLLIVDEKKEEKDSLNYLSM